MEREIMETIEEIIGDVPVAVQLTMALERVALKNHVHDEYALQAEVDMLRAQVEQLTALVGDIPVSEQITMAMTQA